MNATLCQTKVTNGLKNRGGSPSHIPSMQSAGVAAGDRSPAKAAVRVLLVDDHPVVRQGLSACLAARKNICIAGQAADGRQAMRLAKELSPDIVLMDID